jgi:hypothetical protein
MQMPRTFFHGDGDPPVSPITNKAHERLHLVVAARKPVSSVIADRPFTKRRFSRWDFFAKDADTKNLLKKFLAYFPHRHDFIYQKSDGEWLSQATWPLKDTEILKTICYQTDQIYGCRFGRLTWFAVVDLDAGGRYHSHEQIKRLQKVLAGFGLGGSVIFQSSESGGYHLYIPFRSPVDSNALSFVLDVLLTDAGFKIERGHLEIFPNVKEGSKGFGLRLPLQHEWAFLNQSNLVVQTERFELSSTKGVRPVLYVVENMVGKLIS